MKRVKLGLFALAAIIGIGSAFTTKHRTNSGRTYGILGKTALGNFYVVTLFISPDKCNSSTATCSVFITDGGVQETQTPVSGADIIKADATYEKLHS